MDEYNHGRMKPELGCTKVRLYFDRVAAKYPHLTSSGIFGWMRRREKEGVLRLLSPSKIDLILDAGCGSGYYSTLMKEVGASVLGIDVSKRMVEVARARGIDAEVNDLESLDLGLRFDKILCAGVLEFCRDPSKVVRRLRAHLREDGIIVFLVPLYSLGGVLYKLYHLSHGLDITLFSLSQLDQLLGKKAGLRIVTSERIAPFSCLLKTIFVE